jgi:Methylase involved in ubiquinone/menaquinone biosynthesis
MFADRSTKLERIDTGDYTTEEYAVFMREIAFINKYLGDQRALRKTLLRDVARELQKPDREKGISDSFSVLDVGCGSGELLRYVAEFARKNGKQAELIGLDLNEISTSVTATESRTFPEISAVRGDAFKLPFADNTFDYAISSLFFHHLTDEQISLVLEEMLRISRRRIYVIDLHRHPMAYILYRMFCFAFRISPLVTQDGSLSILRGFKKEELTRILPTGNCRRSFPFRLVLSPQASRPFSGE